MKFINKAEAVQVRISDGKDKYRWILLKKGETIELSGDVGLRHGFKKVTNSNQELPKVTEGKIGKKKVETKQIEKKNYEKELKIIKGIGKKTVKDIVNYAPTKEILINKIKNRDGLPFRDDVELKLRRKYGRR